MRSRKVIVLTLLTALAVTLVAISVVAFASAGASVATNPSTSQLGTNGYYPNGMMGGNWGGWMSGMMGGDWGPTPAPQTQTHAPATAQNVFLPIIGFAALIGAALTSTGGAVYYFSVPKTRIAEAIPQTVVTAPIQQSPTIPYSSVSKTLTAEERRVLDVLVSHNGKYLQKYIRAETGMSRLKIHRIVTRLAERGIVTLEKTGNTNEVHLSAWLQTSPILKDSSSKERPSAIEVTA